MAIDNSQIRILAAGCRTDASILSLGTVSGGGEQGISVVHESTLNGATSLLCNEHFDLAIVSINRGTDVNLSIFCRFMTESSGVATNALIEAADESVGLEAVCLGAQDCSLSALERVTTDRNCRELVVGLTSFMKEPEIAALLTATTPTLLGRTSVTEAHISTITYTIILLRHVEMFGEMRRGISVLKMRGSKHDKEIREFTIDERGMLIGRAFRDVTGIPTGNAVHVEPVEIDRVDHLFTARSET